MEVKVFGLGYVGTVTALSLCDLGYKVEGVEPVGPKVESLIGGELHLFEKGLEDLLKSSLDKGTFSPVTKASPLKKGKNILLVCVGTPMGADGAVNLVQIHSVFKDIHEKIKEAHESQTLILLRSTVPPQTCKLLHKEYIEPLSLEVKKNVDFVFFPEFLREGEALNDFQDPRLFCLGGDSKGEERWSDFFTSLPGFKKNKWVSFESAEMIKYAQNSYNALRVAFANEIGTTAKSFGANLTELYDLMREHNELEKPGVYLRPGFSFGGPCLNKEVEALSWLGRKSAHELPLINEIINSNERHFERFLSSIERSDAKSVLFSGVTFKEDTDDLRHSFVLSLVERLVEGPSYLSQKEITIVDNLKVLSRLKNHFSSKRVKLVSLEDLSLGDYDLIIKGPFHLPVQQLQEIEKRKIKVINLGFHSEEIDLPF